METLEDRTVPDGGPGSGGGPLPLPIVPAVFVVTTSQDESDPNNGKTSLREAINLANDLVWGSQVRTITFDMSQVGPVISLGSMLPALQQNITINGPGRASLTVERDLTQARFHVLEVQNTSTATISGLTLQNGDTPDTDGGAIEVIGGKLTVIGCLLRNNRTGGSGGAIATKITDDEVPRLTIQDTTIQENWANFSGGGIAVDGPGMLTMTNCLVGCNSAGIAGGGIWVDGVMDLEASIATLDNVQVTGNMAGDTGGGISAMTLLVLTGNTDLSYNTVTFEEGKGGGLYMGDGAVRFDDVRVGFNDAASGDGIYLELTVQRIGSGLTLYGGDIASWEQIA